MLTKEPDLQKWADSILATEPSERAEMVAEDPSVFEVVRKALDSERQTTAKLRERIEKLRTATIKFADISFERSPWGRLMRDAITEDDRLAKEHP